VRRLGCNAGRLGFYGRPQRAGPAQSPPDQDARAHHREVAPAPATSAKYTMPRNTSSGADHFRAVATMMRDVTFPPVTKHQNTSIQRKRLAAVQGSSRSPLTKKGSMSLYSRIFTVAPLGAFPCAIARNGPRGQRVDRKGKGARAETSARGSFETPTVRNSCSTIWTVWPAQRRNLHSLSAITSLAAASAMRRSASARSKKRSATAFSAAALTAST
jgi:hypothetical protein